MDDVLVVLGVAIPLVVSLAWAIWWLVASTRRDRRRRQAAADYARRYRVKSGLPGDQEHNESPAHLFRGQGEAITVAELLEEARERGEGRRLNWPEEDLDDAGLVRPYAQDQFPTVILPRVEERGEQGDM